MHQWAHQFLVVSWPTLASLPILNLLFPLPTLMESERAVRLLDVGQACHPHCVYPFLAHVIFSVCVAYLRHDNEHAPAYNGGIVSTIKLVPPCTEQGWPLLNVAYPQEMAALTPDSQVLQVFDQADEYDILALVCLAPTLTQAIQWWTHGKPETWPPLESSLCRWKDYCTHVERTVASEGQEQRSVFGTCPRCQSNRLFVVNRQLRRADTRCGLSRPLLEGACCNHRGHDRNSHLSRLWSFHTCECLI